MYGRNVGLSLSTGFLCRIENGRLERESGNSYHSVEGVRGVIPMTRPAQIRIANCFCFLDLRARAPPGGYFGHPLQVMHVVPRLDGVSFKNGIFDWYNMPTQEGW